MKQCLRSMFGSLLFVYNCMPQIQSIHIYIVFSYCNELTFRIVCLSKVLVGRTLLNHRNAYNHYTVHEDCALHFQSSNHDCLLNGLQTTSCDFSNHRSSKISNVTASEKFCSVLFINVSELLKSGSILTPVHNLKCGLFPYEGLFP